MSATTASRTRTPTEARLRIERDGDRSVVAALVSAAPIGLRPLAGRDVVARVAVLQTAACLVAGDDVALLVEVGEGAALDLRDISATLAHPVPPGTAPIRQRIVLRAAAGARVVWAEQPLVVAAGTALERITRLELATGAVVLHRETLVLGRHGEEPGAARVRLRAERDGRPVLDDGLDTGELAALRSPAVLGAARAVGSLALLGAPPPAGLPDGAFALGPLDTLLRVPAASALALAALDAVTGSLARHVHH
jgi:urease accessory protein